MADMTWAGGELIVSDVCFDPQLTLMDSAQVFHWREEGGAFFATVAGRSVCLCRRESGFTLDGVDQSDTAFWRRYFDLDRDYCAIADSLADYPVARRAMRLLPGMRVLNQPPWEALLSFIISANNNVQRIRRLVHQLIDSFGENGGFPTAQRLSDVHEQELRALGFGYRAPYLIRTACMVRDGFALDSLADASYEDAHRMLMRLPGVGDKVADCVQLFGLGQSEAFPVDVWVERLMRSWFIPDAHGKGEIRTRAHQMFGKQAGIVQQSLFHCARLGLIPLDEPEGAAEIKA